MTFGISDPMFELFISETNELLTELELILISNEDKRQFSKDDIDNIFRIMHTIKGSSAMMSIKSISETAHLLESLFSLLRESNCIDYDCSEISDIVLEAIDYFRAEIISIQQCNEQKLNQSLIEKINNSFEKLKSTPRESSDKTDIKKDNADDENCLTYRAIIYFVDDCGMENIRAFTLLNNIKDLFNIKLYKPSDILENNNTAAEIKKNGFELIFTTNKNEKEIYDIINSNLFIKNINIQIMQEKSQKYYSYNSFKQNFISVSVHKLDKLLDLVGELVTTEAMVIQNEDVQRLDNRNFQKAINQLKKITNELQDTVMSIRMVSLSYIFQQMQRIVRDMSRKLNKKVTLEIIGEETEVDKNVIENISDPLIHLIRNAVDHGIETPDQRIQKGKNETGKITLEAKTIGNNVYIFVKDDGRGLDKEKILKKAISLGLIKDQKQELTEKEIYSFIFKPGFTTKDEVSEFSGRGVGMDIVLKDLEKINGSITIESEKDKGTTFILKIPLTLAILNCMAVNVGNTTFTIPTSFVVECFRLTKDNLIIDPDGNEFVYIRGNVYPLVRINKLFSITNAVEEIDQGIVIMVQNDDKNIAIFVDRLIGEQQIVVKPLPKYLHNVNRLMGLSILGDGTVSLILDISKLI